MRVGVRGGGVDLGQAVDPDRQRELRESMWTPAPELELELHPYALLNLLKNTVDVSLGANDDARHLHTCQHV